MDLRPSSAIATAAAITSLLLAGNVLADEAQERARELAAVREQIEAVKVRIDRDTGRRGGAQTALRESELAIAEASRQLVAIRNQQRDSLQRRDQLRHRQAQLESELGAERSGLAEQLRLAYLNGRQERLKLVLNQQDPARLGRLMVYYAYLGDMRAGTITEVSARLGELVEVVREVDAETQRLARLENRQVEELARLELSRNRRGELVVNLEKSLASQDARLQKLVADADALERLIEDIQRALAALPVDIQEPISQRRGKLSWPVAGRLATDFGHSADGVLRSNGVLIAAKGGSDVHALYHGRVAFADWLPGMGLLIVIEHGDGYMSLYGHNEALFGSVGEWVQTGDVIAAVGDSGGQNKSALYFEIRQGKKPVNPHRWMGQRLARP